MSPNIRHTLEEFRDPMGLEPQLPKIQGRELRRLKREYRRCWGVSASTRMHPPTFSGQGQNRPDQRRREYLAHWQTEERAMAHCAEMPF